MTCPEIYLGTGRAVGPLPGLYTNDAIGVSGAPLPTGTTTIIPVTGSNAGTDDSPATQMELYWSDPTTGFQALLSRRIGSVNLPGIPGSTGSPGGDGTASNNFGWTPDATALGTNGGHVCLLAILFNTVAPGGVCVQQTNNSVSPATDPLSAIHNVQLIAPPPPPPPPPKGAPHPRRWPMWFAFAATNTLRFEDTKLHVRALDPAHDRVKLEALVAQQHLNAALSSRRLKFALPNGVQFVEGRERVIGPVGKLDVQQCAPRISRLGALTPELAQRHVLPGAHFLEAAHGPVDLKLLPGEQRQTLVRVEPCDRENVVYAIEIDHVSADGYPIGGLTLLFVPPHDYF
jgi:hypothetical protein